MTTPLSEKDKELIKKYDGYIRTYRKMARAKQRHGLPKKDAEALTLSEVIDDAIRDYIAEKLVEE